MLTMLKQGKMFAAILFLLGAMSVFSFNPSTTYAAKASNEIGVVDYQAVLSQAPDTATAQQTLDTAVTQAKSDFDTQSASMNDQDKQALYQKVQQDLEQKKQELMGPINDKIMAAIKSVADAKGLKSVLFKDSVAYGGLDITNDVEKALAGK